MSKSKARKHFDVYAGYSGKPLPGHLSTSMSMEYIGTFPDLALAKKSAAASLKEYDYVQITGSITGDVVFEKNSIKKVA